jgi:hypothetical protein
MPSVQDTVSTIVAAQTWDQRVAKIRLIPQNHGLGEQPQILATVARQLCVPHLAPDYAYIHESPFYELPFFHAAYEARRCRPPGTSPGSTRTTWRRR